MATKKTTTKKATTKKTASKGGTKKKAASKKRTTKSAAKAPAKTATQQRKTKAATKPAKEKKPSGLNLAAKVLTESKEPLAAKAIAERAIAAGWKTSGKTPHATLYAAMIREIRDKGKDSRFEKVDRGLFKAGKGGA